jgi:hypothetical protein
MAPAGAGAVNHRDVIETRETMRETETAYRRGDASGVETREWPDDSGAGAFGALPARPLLCPACGDSYVHLVEVRVYESTEDGGSGTVVPAGGGSASVRQTPEPGARPFGFRGATVELDAWCEQGHRFALRFSFHKGMTYAHRSVPVPTVG